MPMARKAIASATKAKPALFEFFIFYQTRGAAKVFQIPRRFAVRRLFNSLFNNGKIDAVRLIIFGNEADENLFAGRGGSWKFAVGDFLSAFNCFRVRRQNSRD